jgi:hypothetical protein
MISLAYRRPLCIIFLTSLICFFPSLGGASFNTSELALFAFSAFTLLPQTRYLNISKFVSVLLLFLLLVIISLILDSSAIAEIIRNVIFILCLLWTSMLFRAGNTDPDATRIQPSVFYAIHTFSQYSVYIIAFFSLINIVLGNEAWSSLASSLLMLPSHIPDTLASSWWSSSNGIFANYLNPGSLTISLIYLLCLYLCTIPAGQSLSLPFLLLCAVLLLLAKVTTAFVPAVALILYCFIVYFFSLPLSSLHLTSSRFKLLFFLPSAACLVGLVSPFIVRELSTILQFISFFFTLDYSELCSAGSPSSECVRAMYLASSVSHLAPVIIGKALSSSSTPNPHNFFVYILQYYGFIAFVSYCAFLLGLANRLRYAAFSFLAVCICSYAFFLLPLQGSPWTDGRNFFLFILVVHIIIAASPKSRPSLSVKSI